MPIKLPKGFSRRKSAGNALEDLGAEPTEGGTFRVFTRPEIEDAKARRSAERVSGGSKSFDGGRALNFWSAGRPSRKDGLDDLGEQPGKNLVRGSGASNTNSVSTGGYNDASSSSARLSSASTVPSSTSAHPHEDNIFAKPSQMPYQNKTMPQLPGKDPVFSLKAGGRTFSFGSKVAKPPILSPQIPEFSKIPLQSQTPERNSEQVRRDRGLTESSYASTATPPKIETDLGTPDLGGFKGFGDMFGNIGKRQSAIIEERGHSPQLTGSPGFITETPPTLPPKSYINGRSDYTPARINVDGSNESSPYSWGGRRSTDNLMSNLTPTASGVPDPDEGPPVPRHNNVRALTPQQSPGQTSTSNQNRPRRLGPGWRRSNTLGMQSSSPTMEDQDAKLVLESVNASRALQRSQHTGSNLNARDSGSLPSTTGKRNQAAQLNSEDSEPLAASSGKAGPREIPPRAQTLPLAPVQDSVHDSSLFTAANLATRYEQQQADPPPNPPSQQPQKKVMTPAQFERYRRERELSRTQSNASDSGESENGGDAYDDDDEAERNRELAKQRRKQEAHLAVYRQQMMKVTGEQPSEIRSLRSSQANASSPNLLGAISGINLNEDKAGDAGKSSEDEDDEVPLAILQAHGFPSKNRPPTRLSVVNTSSNPNLRSVSQNSSYPPPAASVAGDTVAGGQRHSQLPVFARGLPQDPYFGASIVNPPNRQSLAFGANRPASAQGGALQGGNLPPGGLVGVIAGEERARAMRRGSPNATGGFDVPPLAAPQSGYPHPGLAGNPRQSIPGPGAFQPPGMMGPMGPQQMLSPGDQAQMQMSHQMQQMMQVQMQWMQQMMQMQGMPNGQPGMNMAPMTNLPKGMGPGMRPLSTYSNSAPASPSGLQVHQRTMSMLDPSMSQLNFRNSTYAPSMHSHAPGIAGYQPSIAPSERSNVGMPSRYRPVNQVPSGIAEQGRASTFSGVTPNWNKADTIMSIKPVASGRISRGVDDEDEEEGWEELKKKREKKRSLWKRKKEPTALQDIEFTNY